MKIFKTNEKYFAKFLNAKFFSATLFSREIPPPGKTHTWQGHAVHPERVAAAGFVVVEDADHQLLCGLPLRDLQRQRVVPQRIDGLGDDFGLGLDGACETEVSA